MRDFAVLWRLCLFRAWASDFNPRPMVLVVFFGLGLFCKLALMGVSVSSLCLSLMSYFWLAAFVYLALRSEGYAHRFMQTYIAACGIVLAQMLCVFLVASFNIGNVFAENIIIVFWSLAILSHVMRNALEVSVTKAVLLTALFELLRYLVLSELAVLWLMSH